MNCLYFACADCKRYLDAGYRWAYWALEDPGIVRQSEPIVIERVLSTSEYWNIDDSPESAWLREKVLPAVRRFLGEHKKHVLMYVDEEWIDDRKETGEIWAEIDTWCGTS